MKIDTETVDAMALTLRTVCASPNPDTLGEISTMRDLLEMEAKATILGGVAVDPCIAVGLEIPNQVRPSHVFNDGEAAFTGKLAGIELVDFTPAIERDALLSKTLKSGEELITHGLVFATEPKLEGLFEGNLGVASLLPYIAILPGSLYRIARLTL